MKKYVLGGLFILSFAFAQSADALYFRYEGGNSGGSYSSGYSTYSSAYALSQTLTAACAPMQASARTGEVVSWYSSTEGGTGSYQLYWSGTDGLSGNTSSTERAYATPGEKFATVTVSSGGQSITVGCTRSVSIFTLAPAPLAAAPVQNAAAKQPVKMASALQAFCASSKDSTAVITSGKDKILITCDKFATTTVEKSNQTASVLSAGIESPLLLILLALGAIGTAIFLAMRKKEKA